MNPLADLDFENTLDPPGRIAVIGGGALGIESALYGRFLGYDVTLFEKGDIGQSLRALGHQPLPMLPDRCLSPLAVSALKAHDGGLVFPGDPTFPMTIAQWIDNGMVRVAATDLLLERVLVGHEVLSIGLCEAEKMNQDADAEDEADDDTYIDGEVPPDFLLRVRNDDTTSPFECEAVIVAIGSAPITAIAGLSDLIDAPYLFRLGSHDRGSEEQNLHRGWHEIVKIYAQLGGREGLDLYRPVRS